jgi:MFS family permease
MMPANAERRRVAALNYGVQIMGCAAFLAAGGANVPLMVVGVLLFGFGIGNATSLPPLIAQKEFSPAQVPRVVALATATAQASYAFAPAAFGLLRDLTNGDGPAPLVFIVAALIQLIAASAYLAGRGRFARR